MLYSFPTLSEHPGRAVQASGSVVQGEQHHRAWRELPESAQGQRQKHSRAPRYISVFAIAVEKRCVRELYMNWNWLYCYPKL